MLPSSPSADCTVYYLCLQKPPVSTGGFSLHLGRAPSDRDCICMPAYGHGDSAAGGRRVRPSCISSPSADWNTVYFILHLQKLLLRQELFSLSRAPSDRVCIDMPAYGHGNSAAGGRRVRPSCISSPGADCTVYYLCLQKPPVSTGGFFFAGALSDRVCICMPAYGHGDSAAGGRTAATSPR